MLQKYVWASVGFRALRGAHHFHSFSSRKLWKVLVFKMSARHGDIAGILGGLFSS